MTIIFALLALFGTAMNPNETAASKSGKVNNKTVASKPLKVKMEDVLISTY